MLINPYASQKHWLFADLLEAFEAEFANLPPGDTRGVETHGEPLYVQASHEPLPDADAWICVRTDELDRSPDLSRTVVQAHDLWRHNKLIGNAAIGAVSLTHPEQQKWVSPAVERRLVLPIGARKAFRLRESMPERFTVGWCGRHMTIGGKDQKRPHLLAEALRELRSQDMPVDVKLLTPNSDIAEMMDGAAMLEWETPDRGRKRTPSFEQLERFYHAIDVLVVTTRPEPGPLSVFEAMRCGVPVIQLEEGAAHQVRSPADGEGWFLGWAGLDPQTPTPQSEQLRNLLLGMADARSLFHRSAFFDRRTDIRDSMPYLQESWLAANVRLACEVAQ